MLRKGAAAAAALSAILAAGAHAAADVKTEEKGHVKFEGTFGRVVSIFGGKAAREGIVSTVAVKGSRKMTANDQAAQVIDLDEEKVYDIDLRKKTYTVTTFEELRRRIREAQAEAEKQAREAETEPEAERQPGEPMPKENGKEVEVDYSLKETGQKKTIAGYDAREVVMTIAVREKGRQIEDSGGLVVTTNMWLGPSIAGMKEIADFDTRYAKKLEEPWAIGASAEQMAAAVAMYPGLKAALARVQSEKVSLDGTPLETVTVMEAVKGKEQLEAEAKQQEESGGSGGLGGMLARRLKKKEPPKARAAFMTITHEVLNVSTSVPASDLALPAGFKQVGGAGL